jgi:hypothetical protein
MTQTQRTPQLVEVMRRAALAAILDTRTATVARVEKYDAGKQTVDVQPLLQEHVEVDGELQAISLAVIPSVPVLFPGAGGFRVTFPIQPGDTVLLVFSDRSLDRWLERGGGPVDPVDLRHHHLQDAVAIPGLRARANALQSAPTDRLSIGKDGGGAVVEITDSVINVLAGTVNLGDATALVARQGDAVQAGPFVGTITAVGQSKTKA